MLVSPALESARFGSAAKKTPGHCRGNTRQVGPGVEVSGCQRRLTSQHSDAPRAPTEFPPTWVSSTVQHLPFLWVVRQRDIYLLAVLVWFFHLELRDLEQVT